MIKKILFLLLLLFLPVFSFCAETVYVLTLPKSGTHCLEKYFNLLDYLDKPPSVELAWSHVSERHLDLPSNYFDDPNVRKILLIRDLRDIFISAVFYVEKSHHWLHDFIKFKKKWYELSLNKKIFQLIDFEHKPKYLKWKYKDRYLPQQIKKMTSKAIRLTKLPNTLVVRFEDLSGGHGPEAQLAVMKEINAFVGVSLNEMEEEFLMNNLFGNAIFPNPFFREGKINQWKSIMKSSLCEKIKHLYGQDLIDLGYERDFYWQSDLGQ